MSVISVTLNNQAYIGVEVKFHTYQDPTGGLALELRLGSQRLAVASVNLSRTGHTPAPGCMFIKNYSENEGMLEALIKAEVVEETGRAVTDEYIRYPEVRIVGRWAIEARQVHQRALRKRIEMAGARPRK